MELGNYLANIIRFYHCIFNVKRNLRNFKGVQLNMYLYSVVLFIRSRFAV